METFLAEKTQRRIDLAHERREGPGTRTDQRKNVTYGRISPTTHPKSIILNPEPRFKRTPPRNPNVYHRNNDYDRRGSGGTRRNEDYKRDRRPHFERGVYITDNVRETRTVDTNKRNEKKAITMTAPSGLETTTRKRTRTRKTSSD